MRMAEARAKSAALDNARLELERNMLIICRIAGRNGLDACVAGILLRVQRQMLGPTP
jgi:hypothetical protein